MGLDDPDDAAVFAVSDTVALVQTVDFFTPIVDDAHAWGAIAAANALSDVYAMGAQPATALNLVAWPRDLDFDLLGRVIEGAAEVCARASTVVVGGHSIDDPEPKFGLAVSGFVRPDAIVTKRGARPGADLVLTKPLGMGIITSGIKDGKTSRATAEEAIATMSALNDRAAEVMVACRAAAATDVTGFGLIGHLREMLGRDVSAELDFAAIPVLEEAFALARAGVYPGGSARNRASDEPFVDAPGLRDEQLAVLFDAQTSGGLLIAIDRGRSDDLMSALFERGVERAARIGRLVAGDGRVRIG